MTMNKITTEDEFTSATVKTMNDVTKKRDEARKHYANEDNLAAARANIFGTTVKA